MKRALSHFEQAWLSSAGPTNAAEAPRDHNVKRSRKGGELVIESFVEKKIMMRLALKGLLKVFLDYGKVRCLNCDPKNRSGNHVPGMLQHALGLRY